MLCRVPSARGGTGTPKLGEGRDTTRSTAFAAHQAMNHQTLLSIVGIGLSAIACGGTTGAPVEPKMGGGVITDDAGDGGFGPIDTDSGAGCTTQVLPGDMACVPGTGQAGSPIEIELGASKGCLACFTTLEACSVRVAGNVIQVSMNTKTCKPPGEQACPALCAIPRSKCTLPVLPAGNYTVQVNGEVANPRTAGRMLVVGDSAQATSACSLPPNGSNPEPLDGSRYATSCSTAADCVAATDGDICKPCKCSSVAISRTAFDGYQSDYRARRSQCAPVVGGPACAGCPSRAVVCDTSKGETGTCRF